MERYIIHDILVSSIWDKDYNNCLSSSDDSDEERKPREKIVKCTLFVENTVIAYSDKTFQSHFRMNRNLIYRLIDRLEQSGIIVNQPNGEAIITSEKTFLLSIWYFANTETFRQTADRFNVSLSSAHRCINKVINFILTLAEEYIKWPGPRELPYISDEFRKKQGIQNVIGAIDGCHVQIRKPLSNQESYYNRKGFHSLLIQGITDNRKMFIDVYCGEPGSIHDARLLRKSAIFSKAQDPNFFGTHFLLGDSAYPCTNWLVTPYKDNGALTRLQRLFNYKHSATRIVIEHAYGLLKGRFRRLFHLDNFSIKFCVKCIMACCILHNICIKEYDDTVIQIPDITNDLQGDIVHFRNDNNSRRQQLFNQLFNVQ